MVFSSMMPYLGMVFFDADGNDILHTQYISPFDPALGRLVGPSTGRIEYMMYSSYAANAQVLQGMPSLRRSFLDGTSQTIFFGEHYAMGCETPFLSNGFHHGVADFRWDYGADEVSSNGMRRPTFADGGAVFDGKNYKDVHPVPAGPGRTEPSQPGVTFQVAPKAADRKSDVPQAWTAAGMLAALADGSGRTVRPGVDPGVFWGAVTPAGGEILADR